MKTIFHKSIKNVAFILLLLLFSATNAQTPIIKEFRSILADAPNKFENYKGEKVSEDKERNFDLYSSKIPELPITLTRIIAKTNDEQSVYFIKFNVKEMDAMMMKLFTIIAGQYITEINDMIKTGKYTGRDFKDGDDDITEVLDSNGNHIVDYISNADAHYIYIYSTAKK